MVASGALTQIAAVGPQDMWLSCDPIITFWKGGYRRYTMFAMAEIEQTFNGLVGFNRRSVATISRSGDLIAQIYLYVVLDPIVYDGSFQVDDTNNAHWTNAVGHAMLEQIRVEIGGHQFDEQSGAYLQIWWAREFSSATSGATTEVRQYHQHNLQPSHTDCGSPGFRYNDTQWAN